MSIYNYEYRKPRLSNPTFISNHVSSSLAFYRPQKISSPPQINSISPTHHQPNQQPTIKPTFSDNLLPKIIQQPHKLSLPSPAQYSKKQNAHNLERYGNKITNSAHQLHNSLQKIESSHKKAFSFHDVINNRLRASNLKHESKLVLDNSFLNLNEKDIFIKQGRNFDIISYKPKQHNQYIKKYPKLSLEERDQCLRLRYINDKKVKAGENFINPENKQQFKRQQQLTKMAGMHTYRLQNFKNRLQHNSQQEYLGKNTNIKQNPPIQSNKPTQTPNSSNKSHKFDMKLLKNMDEFNYHQ